LLGTALPLALLLAMPVAASAVTDNRATANLNRQRVSNGIPAVQLKPRLSDGCRKHNRYMDLNHELTHFESSGRPGYTAAGAEAGKASILAFGTPPWVTPGRNPWETAPIHLTQLLDPTMKVFGYDEFEHYACGYTLAFPRRATPPRLRAYTYPGPGTVIYRGERAVELPKTPGQLAGLPAGKLTGPYIYLLLDGPDRGDIDIVQVVEATLKTAAGRRVAIKSVGSAHQNLGGGYGEFRLYVPPSAFIIPVNALAPNGRYTVHVILRAGGLRIERNWGFRTSSRIG
jgi:cysteine-rich secretory family protein